MNRWGRFLMVGGFVALWGLAAGCPAQQRAGGNGPADVAPVPPERRADAGGLLLNNGSIQLGPGAGGRNGWRWVGDGEWGF